MARGRRYHVYVIALSDAVLQEPRFLKSNPGYVTGQPCVYVGMTGLDPDVRFDKHMAGIQANRYVLRHGLAAARPVRGLQPDDAGAGATEGGGDRNRPAQRGFRRLASLTPDGRTSSLTRSD